MIPARFVRPGDDVRILGVVHRVASTGRDDDGFVVLESASGAAFHVSPTALVELVV